MAVRRRIVVRGRVQGVFFRDTTRRRAESLGVAGWATNRADGTVDFVREGPRRADVDDVDVSEEQPEGLSGFDIR